MIEVPEYILKDLKEYRQKVQQVEQGQTEPERFKPYRVGLGIYEQREKNTYMVRTRIPSGVATLEQLKKISQLADLYSHGSIHFTTRQDIQFHKVSLHNTADIIEGLLEVGIMTKGTGGNTARNIVSSPLSGVAADEVFDVSAYAASATNHLLQDPSAFNLPRKYKIGFSNSAADTANATISDLGFIAKIANGQRGFEVYGGGGLGSNASAAVKLADFIAATEVLYYVQAMKELFENEGDRTNKHKARIRYIVARLGQEGFKEKFFAQLEKVKSEKKLNSVIVEESKSQAPAQPAQTNSSLLVAQNTTGYYAVYIHPENGTMTTEQLNRVISFVEEFEYEPSIRLTNTQGFFVRDLMGPDADKLLQLTASFTSPYPIDNSIACAGASTCQLGLCLSQNLLTAIKERFSNVDEKVKSALPKAFISGCMNSCGQHQIGKIGLSGKAKRVENGLVPMYTIHFGGHLEAGGAQLGESYGVIPAKKVPEFFYQLALLKHESPGTDFLEFIKEEDGAIRNLLDQYSTIETDNPDLYYDFGSTTKFSLKDRGPGECSSGVLDVIELDISNAETYLKQYTQTKESAKLYSAAVSAARALLILKGIDTNKDREIFKQFTVHFVNSGYLKKETTDLIDLLIDYKLGDVENLADSLLDIEYVVTKVKQMYDSLNPQLEITLPKEAEGSSQVATQEEKSADVVDLRTVKCPINFAKAKIALEQIESGETIGFYLDDGEPVRNVPKSVESEGHEIIKLDRDYDGYNLLVVKKK